MRRIRSLIFCLAVFMAGVVFALNLATLLPNPNYDASLSNVFLSAIIGFMFIGCIVSNTK